MNASIRYAQTSVLNIAYETAGPADGPVVVLLHGWPDDVRGWDGVAPRLAEAGFRTIVPYLRGFGPTTFLSSETLRDGRSEALASDVLELADELSIDRFAVVGHDWGARTAYSLASVARRRIASVVALSTAYLPRGRFVTPDSLAQVRAYWYQWFMCTDGGMLAVHRDPKGFAREQWETWGPRGWFTEDDFERTATSFENTDWPDVTLSSYRNRWITEPVDPRYDLLTTQLADVATIAAPTLLITGGADRCTLPSSTEGLEKHFTGGFDRVVLDDVGHFPAREAPRAVADATLSFLKR